jgi:hypothetical protein
MSVCKYCGKQIEGEIVMNPDEYGDGYHHSCLIDKEFREERRRIYNQCTNDVLGKIRAELESSEKKWWYGVEGDCFMKLPDVLQIIDKYKAESEE